jgi:hypothetical protein
MNNFSYRYLNEATGLLSLLVALAFFNLSAQLSASYQLSSNCFLLLT